MNHLAEQLDNKGHASEGNRMNTRTHTHSAPIALSGSLKWSVINKNTQNVIIAGCRVLAEARADNHNSNHFQYVGYLNDEECAVQSTSYSQQTAAKLGVKSSRS